MDQTQQRQQTPVGSQHGSVHDQADPANQIRVEDLPLDKKLEFLKKFNFYQNYEEGKFLDAQDSINSWCLASINGIDNKQILVHFDGWSNRWDVWQRIISYKVAPFRKYSRGYTGQNKIALRQNMKFSLDELHQQKQKVQQLIDQDLNGLGAFETTQYLRGQLYVYVDFLLQNSIYPDDAVDAINDFIYSVLRLIIQWIKKLPRLIPLYSQVRVNSDLYLIDENIAILLSGYEMMDILKKIFGCCHRCLKYFYLNDKEPLPFAQMVTTDINNFSPDFFTKKKKRDEEEIDIDEIKENIISRKEVVFGQLINFVNYFNQFDGFNAIIDFLKIGNEQEDKIPFDMISLMTLPFRNCSNIFSKEFAHTFVTNVVDIVQKRLLSMNDKDIKEIDKEIVGRVLSDLKDIFTLSLTDTQAAEIIEHNLLNISLKFLKSSYLEKRLKGISDIKLMIERVEYAQKQIDLKNQMQIDQRGYKPSLADDAFHKHLKAPKFITASILKDWILRERILEIVLGENTHIEIVKRSGCILKFLAKEAALPIETVELIWKCQLGKHEEMVRVVYHMIQEIIPHVEVRYIENLYQKIEHVPASQYDDKYIEFLKHFTLKSLENYYEFKSNEGSLSESMAESYNDMIASREKSFVQNLKECLNSPQTTLLKIDDKQFGLPIFWELIQDKAPQVTQEIMQLALQSLNEILREVYSQPIRIIYLVKALDNLIKGESLAQSIIVAQNIIDQFKEYEYDSGPYTVANLILHVNASINLVDLIISNIGIYHQQVKEKIAALQLQKKNLPDDLTNYTFYGKYQHHITLNLFINFIEFLISKSDHHLPLGNHNIDTLWKYFVQSPNIHSDQSLFLKWINKSRETVYDRREFSLFNSEERKYFFNKILCNPTYINSTISHSQVKVFHKFFKEINSEEGAIITNRRKLHVLKFQAIQGLDTLWQISIENENEKAREESIDLYVDLHLKFDQIDIQEQQHIWDTLVSKCMQVIEQEGNENYVANTIVLLSKFLDRYEGKRSQKVETKQNQFQMNTTSFVVFDKNTQIRKQVQGSYFQTIGVLRQKIAEAFDMQINEFNMAIKNSYVDPDEDDDKYLKEWGMINNIIIQKNNAYNPQNHPKFLISNNQQNYDRLFTLLSKDIPLLVEPTWELLQKLPTNQKLQQEIKELSCIKNEGWEKILDPKSTNKLYYSLDIISRLFCNRKDNQIVQWRFKFTQLGGFKHLLNTFINLEIKQIDSQLTMKCIEQLILILYDYFMSEKELAKDVNELKANIVLQSVRLMDLISDYTLRVEKKRGESFEDLTRRVIANKIKKNKYKSYMPGNKNQQDKQKQQQEDEEDQESSEAGQLQEMNKQFQIDNSTVTNLYKFMHITVFQVDLQAVQLIAKYPNLEDLIFKSCVKSENWILRRDTIIKMREILSTRAQGSDLGPLIEMVRILFINIQSKIDDFDQRCSQFFEGISAILDGLSLADILPLKGQLIELIQNLSQFILTREIKEKNSTDQDYLLIGRMKLLKSLLQKFPDMKDQIGSQLTYHLLHNCLFEVPQGSTTKSQTKAGPPKCKSMFSRKTASVLLSILCRDSPQNLDMVLTYINQFNNNPSWRTHKDSDWSISLMDSEKSATGYVGLKNLGCICYMNSLFQQLFMIQSFRNDLLSVKEQQNGEPDKDENMLYQLQILYAGLLKSEKQYVSPKGFCHAFKDWEGQPTNVLEQMDVEEFFNMLMDRIETAIKGSPQQNTIQHHFGGKFASEMICKGCPHKYERSEPFLSISIPVKNKKSINEGLTAFIQGDMLEGDNQYFCEKCDKKVDALKRTCVKRLPRHLIVALRRFEFDYDKMIRVKVNDYCEFPLELNMEQFTQEGLARKEKLQKMKEERGEEGEDGAEIVEEPLKYPKEYYEYELSGVVIHSGTADSGHYYSFIKDRDHPETGKWYEFNDHIVRDFDPADIPSECFGGEDTFTGYNMVQMKTMKWRNAYLLIYQRKNLNDVVHSDEEQDKTSSFKQENVEMKDQTTNEELSILAEIEEKIAYENQKYWQNRFLFSNEYQEFVHDVAQYWNTSKIICKTELTKNNDAHITGFPIPPEYLEDTSVPEPLDVKLPMPPSQKLEELEERVFKFAASFYITVLQRAHNKNLVPGMLNLLKAYINKNANCAAWLISEFSNYKLLEENLLQCQSKEMRKFVTGLLYCAMLKLYPEERHLLNLYWQNPQDPNNNKTKIGNFALILLHNIFQVKRFVQNMPQYFQLIARFTSLGPEAKEFMLRGKGIGRLMEFFFDDVSPHKEFFRDFSDINPQYKEKPDIGLPTEIDKKQLSQFQEMLEKRRLKMLADATPKYKYLLEAVSNLIRSFRNLDRSPFQTDDVQFEGLIQQERDLFVPDHKFIKQVFEQANKKRSINAVALAYAHFSWVEKECFVELLNTMQLGLMENEADEARSFFHLLFLMLEKPGADPSENRFNQLIGMFLEVMKQNQNYYKFMEGGIEFIFKIVGRIPTVREWFRVKRQYWNFIREWSEMSRFPTGQMDSNMRLYKRRGFNINQQQMRQEYGRNQVVRDARNQRLKLLAEGQASDTSQEPDIDIMDLQDYKFLKGEQLELYLRKFDKIQVVQVEQVLDEMINIKYLNVVQQEGYQSQTQWIGKDSEKIQLKGTWSLQTRVRFQDYINKQYEQQRQQTNQGASQRGNPNDMDFDQDHIESSAQNDDSEDDDEASDGYHNQQ